MAKRAVHYTAKAGDPIRCGRQGEFSNDLRLVSCRLCKYFASTDAALDAALVETPTSSALLKGMAITETTETREKWNAAYSSPSGKTLVVCGCDHGTEREARNCRPQWPLIVEEKTTMRVVTRG